MPSATFCALVRLPDSGDAGKERTWNKTQRIADHPDGSVTLEMETSGEWEIKRWVLGYGPEAKILAPPELQDSIAEDIRKMQSLYGGSTPA